MRLKIQESLFISQKFIARGMDRYRADHFKGMSKGKSHYSL